MVSKPVVARKPGIAYTRDGYVAALRAAVEAKKLHAVWKPGAGAATGSGQVKKATGISSHTDVWEELEELDELVRDGVQVQEAFGRRWDAPVQRGLKRGSAAGLDHPGVTRQQSRSCGRRGWQ